MTWKISWEPIGESAESAGAECPYREAVCHRQLAVEIADCLLSVRNSSAAAANVLSHARARQENPMPKGSHPESLETRSSGKLYVKKKRTLESPGGSLNRQP